MTMASLLWRHLYLEHGQYVQYFADQFSFTTFRVLNRNASYEINEQVQQAEAFERQTLAFHCFNSSSKFIQTFIPSITTNASYSVWENRLMTDDVWLM